MSTANSLSRKAFGSLLTKQFLSQFGQMEDILNENNHHPDAILIQTLANGFACLREELLLVIRDLKILERRKEDLRKEKTRQRPRTTPKRRKAKSEVKPWEHEG
jgi:hypothetical protein